MRSSTLAIGTLLVLAVSAPLPSADAQSIQACVSPSGKLRVVDDADSCKRKESPLSWNAQGAEGPQGPAGATGAQGPAGPAGTGSGPPPVCARAARVSIERLNGTGTVGVFEASAFSFGLTYEPPLGAGTGVLAYTTFNLTKALDATSAALFEAASEGTHFPSATIEVLDGSGAAVVTYTLGDVVILFLSQGPPTCGTVPSEALGFEFATVTPDED